MDLKKIFASLPLFAALSLFARQETPVAPEFSWKQLVQSTNHFALQGGAAFGDYYFQFHGQNNKSSRGGALYYGVEIFNLTTREKVQEIMVGFDNLKHNNSVSFGTEYYDKNDKFPLLYASQEGADARYVTVYRIIETGSAESPFGLRMVQIIQFPGISESDFTYPNAFFGDGHMILNGFDKTEASKFKYEVYEAPSIESGETLVIGEIPSVDVEGNAVTVPGYTLEDGVIVRRNDGDSGTSVKYLRVKHTDLIKSFKIDSGSPYYDSNPTTQGGCISDKTIFQVFGHSSAYGGGILRAIDFSNGTVNYTLNLSMIPELDAEPEAAFVYKGRVGCAFNGSGRIVLLDFGQDVQSTQKMKSGYIVPEEAEVREHLARWQNYKFGMFIHWGVYSELGVIESWSLVPKPISWMYRGRKERNMTYNEYREFYQNIYKSFNPMQFDPSKWADAAAYAGMKYLVFTTKHHDGFCMFDTKATDYKITSPDCPYSRYVPNANITQRVFEAFRGKGIKPGAYFSIADWHNQDFWWDFFPPKDAYINYPVKDFPEKWENFQKFVEQQVDELTDGTYGPLEMLWFDMGFSTEDGSTGISWDRLAQKARANQPGIMMVARSIGGKYENYKTPEQAVPDEPLGCPWESCITMTGSWSYRPGWEYKSTREILNILVKVVSRGGNLLLNVGPRPDGTLEDEAYERLHEIGDWMKVNSEGIYGTKTWTTCQDGKICFTAKDGNVYAFYLADEGETQIPAEVTLHGVTPATAGSVTMLGYGNPLHWKACADGGITVTIPSKLRDNPVCKSIWTLKIGI